VERLKYDSAMKKRSKFPGKSNTLLSKSAPSAVFFWYAALLAISQSTGFGTTETQIGSKGGNKTSNLKPSGQTIDQQLTRRNQKVTNKNGRSQTNIILVK
jgi:hypothetical protein